MKKKISYSQARMVSKNCANDFFVKLNDCLLKEILPFIEFISLHRGEFLIRQGDSSDSIYFLLKGTLNVKMVQENDKEIFLAKISPGEPVGEIQALTGGKHTASVYAYTNADVIRLSNRAFRHLTQKAPEFINQLFEIIKKRLLRTQLAVILPTLFGQLDKKAIQDIEEQIEWLHLRRGEVLFQEGEHGDSLYIVLFGRLRVFFCKNKAEEVLGEVGRGETIGEMALFTSQPRSATVRALRECDLVRIPQSVFGRIIKKHPQVMMPITRILIDRLQKTSGRTCRSRNLMNVAVIPVSRSVPLDDFSTRIFRALGSFGHTLRINRQTVNSLFTGSARIDKITNEIYSLRISTWLNELETNHDFIIYEADEIFSPWTLRCLDQADQILLLAHSSDDPLHSSIAPSLLNRITSASCSLIILHPEWESLPSDTNKWMAVLGVNNVHHVRWGIESDLERIARFIAGKTVSLVLSGGGARGFAHIGVIRALREVGIPIDMIGGTSMGAVVASGYAMGLDDEGILEKARRNFVTDKPLNDFTLPFISLFRSQNIDKIIERGYGKIHIEDLWINYFCISSNLSTAELEVHKMGLLWKAIRASVSYPGITAPVVKGNHLLVDGGVLNNLPIDIMSRLCNGTIIASDVSVDEELTIHYNEIPSPWKILWSRILPFKEHIYFPSILDILVRTAELSCIHRRHQIIKDAGLYLRPPVNNYRLLGFDSIDELVDIGYRYAKKEIEKWSSESPTI